MITATPALATPSATTSFFLFFLPSPPSSPSWAVFPLLTTILDAFSAWLHGLHTASSSPANPPPVPQSLPESGRMLQEQLLLGVQAPGMVSL